MPAADLRTRIWRVTLVALAVAFGMALGAVLSGGLDQREEAAATPIGPDVGEIRVVVDEAGPTDKIDGVGVGFAHTEQGAVAAATNLLLTIEQAATSDRSTAMGAFETLAAEASRQTLADEMGATWDALNGGVIANGPAASALFLRTVPIGQKIVRYEEGRATIEIWTLTLVAAAGMVEPLATYETSVVEVVWEESDWKVWSATSTDGPVPGTGVAATAVDAFLGDVQQLEGYRYAAS